MNKLTPIVLLILATAACSNLATVRNEEGVPLTLAVSEMERVTLGDTEQWIYVQGTDATNPVLLWLDGGPGGTEVGWVRSYLGPLHEHFTIVCWDQRGTGKSYGAVDSPRDLKLEDYVDDVIALSGYLLGKFNTQKIYLAGHSWGSIIGTLAAARSPELYAAYIGIGQQVNGVENDTVGWHMVHDGALAEGKTDVVKKLEEYGLPPYDDGEKYYYLLSRLYGYSPRPTQEAGFDSLKMFLAPEHNLGDRINIVRGLLDGVKLVYPQVAELDFERDVPSLDCPVFIVNGRYDYTCVATIAERWFTSLSAPIKDLRWFENSGHEPCYTEAEGFMSYMTDVVLAMTAEG